MFLVNASGGVALLVYLVIAFSQLRMRKSYEKKHPEKLKIRMWLFPYLTYGTIVGITSIFITMPFIDSLRTQFFLTLLIALFIVGSFFLTRSRRNIEKVKIEKNIS